MLKSEQILEQRHNYLIIIFSIDRYIYQLNILYTFFGIFISVPNNLYCIWYVALKFCFFFICVGFFWFFLILLLLLFLIVFFLSYIQIHANKMEYKYSMYINLCNCTWLYIYIKWTMCTISPVYINS